MKSLIRYWDEHAELIITAILIITIILVEVLDFFEVIEVIWSNTMMVVLLAGIATLLVTLARRIQKISEDINSVKSVVQPEIAIHRERVYEQSIDLLRKLSADASLIKVRIYVPVGFWKIDSAKRQWFREIVKLTRDGKISLSAVYGTPENKPDFHRMKGFLEEMFVEVEQKWITNQTPKHALFYFFPPSSPKPHLAILLMGEENAEMGFAVSSGYEGLQRSLTISGENTVTELVDWYKDQVERIAIPINQTQSIKDGLEAFYQAHYK